MRFCAGAFQKVDDIGPCVSEIPAPAELSWDGSNKCAQINVHIIVTSRLTHSQLL